MTCFAVCAPIRPLNSSVTSTSSSDEHLHLGRGLVALRPADARSPRAPAATCGDRRSPDRSTARNPTNSSSARGAPASSAPCRQRPSLPRDPPGSSRRRCPSRARAPAAPRSSPRSSVAAPSSALRPSRPPSWLRRPHRDTRRSPSAAAIRDPHRPAPRGAPRPAHRARVFTWTCSPTARRKSWGRRSGRSMPGVDTSSAYGPGSKPSRSSRRDTFCESCEIVSRSTPPSRSTVTRRILRPLSRPKVTSTRSRPSPSITGLTSASASTFPPLPGSSGFAPPQRKWAGSPLPSVRLILDQPV